MIKDLKQCELCGKPAKLIDTIIEGSLISVCKNCGNYGKAVFIPDKPVTEKAKPRNIKIAEETIHILKSYPQHIKQAREKLNLKQKELAQKIGEKGSIIHQLESGHLEPSTMLAKKLEKFLKIKLMEKYEESKEEINFSDTTVTIGDLLKLRKK